MPIYIDIDGTLTDDPRYASGKVLPKRIQRVKTFIKKGIPVVIWSAGGGDYARRFCETNGIVGAIPLGKPRFCVDDCKTIRPELTVRNPSWLDK